MTNASVTRFAIRFDPLYRGLSTALLLPPSAAYVEIEGDEVRVRMGWAFRARFPRTAIAKAGESSAHPLSRGVHGLWGRWLVNGSGNGIVVLDLDPKQRAYVVGVPVGLRQLMVSAEDPGGMIAALTPEADAE
jgi:hypothetical protein